MPFKAHFNDIINQMIFLSLWSMLLPISQKTLNVINHFVTKMKTYVLKIRSVLAILTAIGLEYMNLSFTSYHYLTFSFIALAVLDLFQTNKLFQTFKKWGNFIYNFGFFKKTTIQLPEMWSLHIHNLELTTLYKILSPFLTYCFTLFLSLLTLLIKS